MVSIPNKTSLEFIDGLLDILSKFEETLVAARSFVATNSDMIADGGDPFEAIPPDTKDGKWLSDPPFDEPTRHEPVAGSECVTGISKLDFAPADKWEHEPHENFKERRVTEIVKAIHEASDAQNTATKPVVKKRRAKPVRRTSVTPELREKILDALLNRNPRPRMVDIASEFEVSQSTISRLWGIYQGENPPAEDRGITLPGDSLDTHQHVQLPGQLELPTISEGRKPGLED